MRINLYISSRIEFAMRVEINKQSKIDAVDFDNLDFGMLFTDHMFVCDYKDGEWKEPQIIPYQPIAVDPSMSALHYGQAVFEGMKAYKDKAGEVFLFRPEENFNRINRSSERLAIPAFPKSYFFEGLEKLLALDKEWIKSGIGNSLYIRPFVFASQAGVQASASNEYKFMIICAPVGAYYGGEMHVKIAEKYSRAAQGGVGYAKAAGNYAAQFYPTKLAQDEGYQQVIWTDAHSHEYLEEAGTMNIFFRIGERLVTAPTTDTILDGVTRKSIIKIAEHLGIEVEVRPVRVDEIIAAHTQGQLKEVFGAGTAVVVSQIHSIGYKGEKYTLPKLDNYMADQLKSHIMGIQYNELEDPFQWRHPVRT